MIVNIWKFFIQRGTKVVKATLALFVVFVLCAGMMAQASVESFAESGDTAGDFGIATKYIPFSYAEEPFSFRLQAAGGSEPYKFSLAEGSRELPRGLSLLEDGTITGTPKESGAFFGIKFKVTDASQKTAEKELRLDILPYIINFTATDLFHLYDGQPKQATVQVENNKYNLVENQDYEVLYGGEKTYQTNPGSYSLKINMLNPSYYLGTINGTRNGVTFEIVARREGKLEAGAGNSPVAAIRKKASSLGWEQDKTEQAIEKFKASRRFSTFEDGDIPEGFDKTTVYSEKAWQGAAGNMDEDEKAVFVSNIEEIDLFNNPLIGNYEATYGDGAPVLKEEMRVLVKGLSIRDTKVLNSSFSARKDYDIKSQEFEELKQNKGNVIRDGVYELEYSFMDKGLYVTPKEIKAKKYIVVHNRLGDLNLDKNVNGQDRVILKKVIASPEQYSVQWVYRCCDINRDGSVNQSDLEAFDKRFGNKLKGFYGRV